MIQFRDFAEYNNKYVLQELFNILINYVLFEFEEKRVCICIMYLFCICLYICKRLSCDHL